MTLRDWFAGQMLPAVYASELETTNLMIGNDVAMRYHQLKMAREAYCLADAMLKERMCKP
jgi:hypothetical protein